MRVILIDPQIPANTGNIGRLCLATGCELVIVGRPGFSLSEKAVRRAGVDHWREVRLRTCATLVEALAEAPRESVFLFESGAQTPLWQARFGADATLVFGNENPGLPADVLAEWADRTYHIPMPGPVRSLNLANAAAVAVYEALRQTMKCER